MDLDTKYVCILKLSCTSICLFLFPLKMTKPSLLRFYTNDPPPPGPTSTACLPAPRFSSTSFSYLKLLLLDVYCLPLQCVPSFFIFQQCIPLFLKNLIPPLLSFFITTHSITVVSFQIIH